MTVDSRVEQKRAACQEAPGESSGASFGSPPLVEVLAQAFGQFLEACGIHLYVEGNYDFEQKDMAPLLVHFFRNSPAIFADYIQWKYQEAREDATYQRYLQLKARRIRSQLRRTRLPSSTKQRILERDGHRCRHCGAADSLQIDHITPCIEGGSSRDANLQILCARCNMRKGAKGFPAP